MMPRIASPGWIPVVAVFLIATSLLGQPIESKDDSVTAVEGESWIHHLHRPFDETSMGKTWDLGPPPPEPGDMASAWHLELTPGYASQKITLHGSDLYRLNCRGCHGELGLGMPPEINSIIGPVEATSAAATMEQMKKAGREMSRSDANELAKESRTLLLQRLHVGGVHMPAPTLSEAEIRCLIPYLDLLSGVPGAAKDQTALRESADRIGEHIVKSTCHVCHDAMGPNPDPQQILDGSIPPLSTLTGRVTLAMYAQVLQRIRKFLAT